MTDAISQYGRQGPLDSSSRASREGKVSAETKAAPVDTYAANQATALEKKPTVSKPGHDTLVLSDVAKKALSEPSFDRTKVDGIKQAIRNGQYPLDPRRIAESFMAIEKMIRG